MKDMKSENKNGRILEFPAGEPEQLPDVWDMTGEELAQYRRELEQQIAELDAREPKNMLSEAYEAWADRHEELEDLLDEVLDRMEELGI